MKNIPPSEDESIFGRFRKRFKLPLNTFLKRSGPLISFDVIAFDKWLNAGDEAVATVADRKYGPGAADLVKECCSFVM